MHRSIITKAEKSVLDNYLKSLGTASMKGNLNMNNHRRKDLNDNPQVRTDAVNKNYVDNVISTKSVLQSHNENIFSYLMSNAAEFTDELGNSFAIIKYQNLPLLFHKYNKR